MQTKLDKLPDIENCSTSIYNCEFTGKDGYLRKQTKTYKRKNPYRVHKSHIKSLIDDMTDTEFKEFFKSIDWKSYER